MKKLLLILSMMVIGLSGCYYDDYHRGHRDDGYHKSHDRDRDYDRDRDHGDRKDDRDRKYDGRY